MAKLLSGDAAREAEVSVDTIHEWVRRGWLRAERTPRGFRVFDGHDVARIAGERKAARGGRGKNERSPDGK